MCMFNVNLYRYWFTTLNNYTPFSVFLPSLHSLYHPKAFPRFSCPLLILLVFLLPVDDKWVMNITGPLQIYILLKYYLLKLFLANNWQVKAFQKFVLLYIFFILFFSETLTNPIHLVINNVRKWFFHFVVCFSRGSMP